jgi:hypothetical protein
MRSILLLALCALLLDACSTPQSSSDAIRNLRSTQPTPGG